MTAHNNFVPAEPCMVDCSSCRAEAAERRHPTLFRLARVQPFKFVREHVQLWWWWRDLTIGLTIGQGCLRLHLPGVAVEVGRKKNDWWSE